MAEISGTNVVALTEEEKKKQEHTVSDLINHINDSNTDYLSSLKEKEEESQKQQEEENYALMQEIVAKRSKNFALASEKDHQELLERIKQQEEEEEKQSKKKNFLFDTLHMASVLTNQTKHVLTEKKQEKEPNTVTETVIHEEVLEEKGPEKVIISAPEKTSQDDYYYIATHDVLTGLKNRRAFESDQSNLLLDKCAVVSIDVNNLKYMNDTYGHEIGDLLLQSVGEALSSNFDEENSYRFGGDEFLAVCRNAKQADTRAKRFERALDKLTKKYQEKGYIFAASVGIATYMKASDDDINKMIARADAEMYKEKQEYKSRHPELNMRITGVPNKEEMEAKIRAEIMQEQKATVITAQDVATQEELEARIRAEILAEQEEAKRKEEEARIAAQPKTADDLSVDEYNEQLPDEILNVKEQALSNTVPGEVSLARILNNIQQREGDGNNQLFYVCIATIDMNALILLKNVHEFVELIEEADVDYIQCSYIYALFSTGAAWYGNNLPVKGIQSVFDAMVGACLAKRGRPLTQEEVLRIPDIQMFKDIYM